MTNDSLYQWFLTTNPWTEYNTRINLFAQAKSEPLVISSKQKMLEHPLVKVLLQEVNQWPWYNLKRHNDANHPIHKLVFLADLGLTKEDQVVDSIIENLFQNQSQEGAFQVPIEIPRAFGGNDQDQLTWMLCDNPSMIYALIKFGWEKDPKIAQAIKHLISLQHEQGWLCTVSPSLGKFRGPGRKDDPCPYATLLSLKVLANMKDYRESKACLTGAEALLSLWGQRKERKPYLFGMGTDFQKLKAPLIWYDIIHLVSVLVKIPKIRKDERLLEMINIIQNKKDEQGFLKAESIWTAWKEWDFGQKKEPSPWITYLTYQIEHQLTEK
ncbi:MAG: hypothetical protein JXA54_04215 [Candidatus Heimdallarchaeota archaeon]|nr:hypothetical protein [Candidatus Heimdallarchaeota archaeon]